MVDRRQRINNRRMMQCTNMTNSFNILNDLRSIQTGSRRPMQEEGRGLASGSAWWIVCLLDTHRWRTIMCAPSPSDWVSSCCVYDLFMFFSFTLLFNQITLFIFCLESIAGDSASRATSVRVSNFSFRLILYWICLFIILSLAAVALFRHLYSENLGEL